MNTIGGQDIAFQVGFALGDEQQEELDESQLNNLLVLAVRDYSLERPFLRRTTITTVADQDLYALPDDAIRAVEVQYRKESDVAQSTHPDDYLPEIVTAGLIGMDFIRRQLRIKTDEAGVGHVQQVDNLTSYGAGHFLLLYPAPTIAGTAITIWYSSLHPLVYTDYPTIPIEHIEPVVGFLKARVKEWQANKEGWGTLDYDSGQTRMRTSQKRIDMLADAQHARAMAILSLQSVTARYG